MTKNCSVLQARSAQPSLSAYHHLLELPSAIHSSFHVHACRRSHAAARAMRSQRPPVCVAPTLMSRIASSCLPFPIRPAVMPLPLGRDACRAMDAQAMTALYSTHFLQRARPLVEALESSSCCSTGGGGSSSSMEAAEGAAAAALDTLKREQLFFAGQMTVVNDEQWQRCGSAVESGSSLCEAHVSQSLTVAGPDSKNIWVYMGLLTLNI